ncbi:hypothetical protein DER46DRAFT_397969 [Fusarium sp. MPI-SDFR-AT-0072]|nr:hypothetical protein DER46DRAFT_397969 [Fusarium sp. MPI-SDFR-AT-0072]
MTLLTLLLIYFFSLNHFINAASSSLSSLYSPPAPNDSHTASSLPPSYACTLTSLILPSLPPSSLTTSLAYKNALWHLFRFN